MTYIVGLTGGIGSGKSTASNYFAELGVPIIDADLIARELVAKDQPAFNKICQYFGPTVLQKNGELDRHLLREIIFNVHADKQWLEALLHPLIDQTIAQKIEVITSPYCIVIIPLLAEHYQRYRALLNEIVVVVAAPERQLNWLIERDPSDKQLIQKMIASQATTDSRIKIANHILQNDGSREEFKNKIRNLHQIFLSKCR